MHVHRWFFRAAAFIALVAVIGCSADGDGSFATVSGTVTHNGSPVGAAKVTLHSTVQAKGQEGGVYSVLTDSSGKYLIASVGKNPGIPPGMYKVTITKLDEKGGLPEDFDQGQLEASGSSFNRLPADYENVSTTKLTVTVEAGKNEDKNFDLKGEPTYTKVQGVP